MQTVCRVVIYLSECTPFYRTLAQNSVLSSDKQDSGEWTNRIELPDRTAAYAVGKPNIDCSSYVVHGKASQMVCMFHDWRRFP